MGVQIEVISGKNLPNLDMEFEITQLGMVQKPSDPYVICTQGGKELFKTPTVKNSADPEWNHQFAGTVDPTKGDLVFTVYDQDTFKQDDYIGTCTVPIRSKEDDYTLNASSLVKAKTGGQAASKRKRKATSELSTLKIKVVAVGDEALASRFAASFQSSQHSFWVYDAW